MSSRLPAHERREQHLDRALELFAAKGYARATTSQLAKAAGVTEPIIYRHFKSKKELFVALIERTGQETLDQWSRELEPVTDPAERLKKLIGENPMVSPRGRATYRVFLQAITEVDDPEIKAAIQSLYGVRVERVSTQIRKGKYFRTRFGPAKSSDWKKATVQLHEEDRIELF